MKTNNQIASERMSEAENEMIKIEEVQQMFKRTNKPSVKSLLDEMNKYDQRKIERYKLTTALKIQFCVECNEKQVNEEGQTCGNCEKEKKAVQAEIAEQKSWKELCVKLNEEANEDIYKQNENGKRITREYKTPGGVSITLQFYRDDIYSGTTFHSRLKGHAIRIHVTNNKYVKGKDRLQKDFDSEGIAKSLHYHAEKMVEQFKNGVERKETELSQKETLIEKIKKELPTVSEVKAEMHYAYHDSKGYERTIANIEVDGIEFTLNCYDNDYSVLGTELGHKGYTKFHQIKAENVMTVLKALAKIAKLTTQFEKINKK